MKEKAMNAESKGLFALDPGQRRRFWARLCRMGIVRERELVGVHRVAQERRIPPEAALVATGILTAEQAAEFLNGDAPFGFSMGDLGVS
jgi:hypothetical protein